MKLVYSVSLIATALSQNGVALPSAYDEPLLDKRGLPTRFHVKSSKMVNGVQTTTVQANNLTALYDIPDDLKNWPWWCSSDRSYCGASWAPTVDESTALADYLGGLGDAECTLERPQNSNIDAYKAYAQVNSHAKVGAFFTHLGDTDRAYAVSFPCLQMGYILHSLIEACQCNGRVVGSTPLPNCWINWLSFTGDQNSPPGGVSTWPGAGVGIAPYP